jgi:disulfide bond formation protein DsbB
MNSIRKMYSLGFVATAALIGFSYYLEFYSGFVPCPLCLLQRFAMVILSLFFLFGAVLSIKKFGYKLIGFLSLITSLLGVLLAGRQVWLQHLPSAIGGNCEVSLQYMLRALPLQEVLSKVFAGTSECTRVDWQFLNLSLAEWSLICFIVFSLFSLWQLFRRI